jgi:CheY-like chemotaxis protein
MLKNAQDVDAILVDIMMPDMDGYETMHEIRKMRRFKKTPIIALTAKAMKGDRDKCIAAGASDYVSKPADVERLLSLLRMYLNK